MFLFPGSIMQDVMIVKEGQNCQSPIETTYYTDIKMDDICFFCGKIDNLADGEVIQELQRKFGTVRLICNPCWQSGKEPITRNKKVKRN
ncbi:hypothetical protein MAR_029176 [Mya arenaria]|uniref:Uncharacterized protein n=1 Tax=Mya arenaria TaxID=6604 RepID=A0ABY7DIP8_MYAAR|nr:hypothetical protein MAR_029176 [Mya arenaria]